MFKVGDRVVCIDKDYVPYIELHEVCEIVDVDDDLLTVSSSFKGRNGRNVWYIQIDDVVSYEIYNSPLYQLMKEKDD